MYYYYNSYIRCTIQERCANFQNDTSRWISDNNKCMDFTIEQITPNTNSAYRNDQVNAEFVLDNL